jgi:hypothetical protein
MYFLVWNCSSIRSALLYSAGTTKDQWLCIENIRMWGESSQKSCLLGKEWLCYRIWFIAIYKTLWRSSSKEEKRRLRPGTILPCCYKIVLYIRALKKDLRLCRDGKAVDLHLQDPLSFSYSAMINIRRIQYFFD